MVRDDWTVFGQLGSVGTVVSDFGRSVEDIADGIYVQRGNSNGGMDVSVYRRSESGMRIKGRALDGKSWLSFIAVSRSGFEESSSRRIQPSLANRQIDP